LQRKGIIAKWDQTQESVGQVSLVEKKELQSVSFGQKNTVRKTGHPSFRIGQNSRHRRIKRTQSGLTRIGVDGWKVSFQQPNVQ
jgi:hypothetical protein